VGKPGIERQDGQGEKKKVVGRRDPGGRGERRRKRTPKDVHSSRRVRCHLKSTGTDIKRQGKVHCQMPRLIVDYFQVKTGTWKGIAKAQTNFP